MTGPRVTAPPRPPRPGHGPGRPGARRGGRGTRGSARHGPERGSARPGRSCARRRPLGAAGRAVPSSPGNFGFGALGGLEIPEHSRPPPPGVLPRALPGSSGAPHVPYFPLGSTEGFAPRRPRPPVPLRVPVPLRCHEPFPSQTCSAARLKLPAETPGFPKIPPPHHPSCTGMCLPHRDVVSKPLWTQTGVAPKCCPQAHWLPPGQGNLSRTLQSQQPLARHPKGRFPSPPFQLTQQSLHPSPGGGQREAFAIRVPIASFPLASEWKGQPQSSLWKHLPPPQHAALDASRRPQQGTASSRGPQPHPLLLTEEEEVGLSNPFSPSMATGTASTTHRSSAGAKVCLTTQNHRRLLAKGQDQGRAYGHAPHFFSLTNEKKKKSHI